MEIREHVPLAPLTTLRLGGAASFFCVVRTLHDLEAAAGFARIHGFPLIPIGEGSNILVSDRGFEGLVVKMELRGVALHDTHTGKVFLEAAAGEVWDELVEFSVRSGLHGLENLSLIPGSVGAAPVQNIGAYGAEVSDTLSKVEVFDVRTGKHLVLEKHDCALGYRDSIFRRPEGAHLVITKAIFELETAGRANLGYPDLKARFKDRYSKDVSPREIREAVIEIRRKKLPDWHVVKTAGSFFKNPIMSDAAYEKLKERYPGVPAFRAGDGMMKVPLAWILDKILGVRGLREGEVGLWESQPLTLVAYEKASASEVYAFAERIAKRVHDATGITLEWEVRRLGSLE